MEVTTMIPEVNIYEVAGETIGIYTAMIVARQQFSEATLAYFLDLVPERGEQLWNRFRRFQKGKGDDIGFFDFIRSMVTADPVKPFFPKDCILSGDPELKKFLAQKIGAAISAGGVHDNAGVFQIYFADGAPYQTAHKISCKGYPESSCRHNFKFKKRR